MASMEEEKERVRASSDLVEIVAETVLLRQRGSEFWGCCPFHGEKSPSFHIIPATQVWHCFGCGKGGDVFTYIMDRENLSFPEALGYLADRAGIELTKHNKDSETGSKKARLLAANDAARDFFHTMLMRSRSEGAGEARSYFAGRTFNGDVCRKWCLGYAPGNGTLVAHLSNLGFSGREMEDAGLAVNRNGQYRDRFYDRVMFPIFDEFGKVIAFGGRVLGQGEPKYLNSKETTVFHKGKNLYALNEAKQYMVSSGYAVVSEGYTDVIACHEAGVNNVVATLGTALTQQHVKTLSRFSTKIIYLFDGDAAGQNAAERALQFVGNSKADFFCAILPKGQDPMDFVVSQGGEALKKLLERPVSMIQFVLDKHLASHELGTPEQRQRALEDCVNVLVPLRGTELAGAYIQRLSDQLMANPEDVRQMLNRAKALPKPRFSPYEDKSSAGQKEKSNVNARRGVGARTHVSLSADDARALRSEAELLYFMSVEPDLVKRYGDRIAELTWADSRNEAVCWAIMSTPEGTTPADALVAALEVEPQAAQMLSEGRLGAEDGYPTESLLEFVIIELEIASLKRRVSKGRAELRSSNLDPKEEERVFSEVTELQKQLKTKESSGKSGLKGPQ